MLYDLNVKFGYFWDTLCINLLHFEEYLAGEHLEIKILKPEFKNSYISKKIKK